MSNLRTKEVVLECQIIGLQTLIKFQYETLRMRRQYGGVWF